MALFKIIGEPVTVPTVLGYQNLPLSHLSGFVEDIEWQEYDFDSPKNATFWAFDDVLFNLDMDCSRISRTSILFGSDWQFTTQLGLTSYALKFANGYVIIQQVEPADLVLPDLLTNEQVEDVIAKLSCHVYQRGLNPEPSGVATVIRDLVRYSDLQDSDFDSFKDEPTVELLNELFDQCRKAKDLRAVLDNFFNLQLGRNL